MIGQWLACLSVFLTSLWSQFDKPRYRVLRGVLFVGLGVEGIVPFIHIVVLV